MCPVTDKRLEEVYPGFLGKPEYYKKRLEKVCEGFKSTFEGNFK